MKMISRSSLILAGDVGGTKTMLGLYQSSEDGIGLIRAQSLPSKAYGGLKNIIEEFINVAQRINAACFGVAGPVIAGTAVATNLPWQISETSLRRFLSIRNVSLTIGPLCSVPPHMRQICSRRGEARRLDHFLYYAPSSAVMIMLGATGIILLANGSISLERYQ